MSTISHAAMRRHGWERVDGRKDKFARWLHTESGWGLAHCGHPTALRPWALVRPDGRLVCSDVRFGGPPNFGVAWASLREPVEWFAGFLRSGVPLLEDEGASHHFGVLPSQFRRAA